MGYVIKYDYDYKSSENYDYNYDYDYLKKCNQLQSNTIAITITPALECKYIANKKDHWDRGKPAGCPQTNNLRSYSYYR